MKQSTNAELHKLMQSNSLTRERVAELVRASIHTVGSWLKPSTNRSFRKMPASSLELLTEKLKGGTRK